MVAYSDVPAVNALYAEQDTINKGLAILDGGGSLSHFTLVPAPYVPPAPPDPAARMATPRTDPPVPISPMAMMPVSIMTVAPTPELLAQVRIAMVDRANAITAELTTLGVTDAPPPAL